ncbi:MAG TPA: hypothetical protein VMT12_16945 [Syntrophales bacterium]|nr:hypothetical protein [Syntrophales bacterium]
MDKGKSGKANKERGAKRLADKDTAKTMKEGDTSNPPQSISAAWKVTAINQTPDEILEKVFRGNKEQLE